MCHDRWSDPVGTSPARGHDVAVAARAFYRGALRGRQVWPTGRTDGRGSLCFIVGGTLVEVRPELGSAAAPIELEVDDPNEVAERCWDAGFDVLVGGDATGGALVSVLDPFGRRIELTPRDGAMDACLAAGEEQPGAIAQP